MSESFFLLATGRVRVERARPSSTEPLLLAEIGAGEVIGEMARWIRLLRYSEVAAALLRGLSQRLRAADERMEHVSIGEPIATASA